MAADPIAEYQKALGQLESAEQQVSRLVQTIRDAANKLRDWNKVNISNVNVGFPLEIASGHLIINARDWPTAQQLAEALTGWHNARLAAGNAWKRIPENRRRGLEPPPQ